MSIEYHRGEPGKGYTSQLPAGLPPEFHEDWNVATCQLPGEQTELHVRWRAALERVAAEREDRHLASVTWAKDLQERDRLRAEVERLQNELMGGWPALHSENATLRANLDAEVVETRRLRQENKRLKADRKIIREELSEEEERVLKAALQELEPCLEKARNEAWKSIKPKIDEMETQLAISLQENQRLRIAFKEIGTALETDNVNIRAEIIRKDALLEKKNAALELIEQSCLGPNTYQIAREAREAK